MSSNKSLEIDMIAGSQLRDSQGEMLDVAGADISVLERGEGRLNDNHGKGFFNAIGRVTFAKKIFSKEDCDNERQEYYWDKVKSPYIYVKGELYDDEDHPNAKAAAAILRNIHKEDVPLKLKASVEGGTVARGIKDPQLLARTIVHSVALTFTPANKATLVEPTGLNKTDVNTDADYALIKSVVHLAEEHVPSFRSIARTASAQKIVDNVFKIQELSNALGLESVVPTAEANALVEEALEKKISSNVNKIHDMVKSLKKNTELNKALTAGYGGAGVPTNGTHGAVIQSESLNDGRENTKKSEGFKYITCHTCGTEQVYAKFQVKCRECNKGFPLEELGKLMV